MAISTLKHVLLFTIIMVSMNDINSQLQIEVSKVPDIIITLLENITDTSTTTSMFLPHLANLLKKQEDVQRLTNLILQNQTDTCAVEGVSSILQEFMEDRQEYQDRVFVSLHDQQNVSTELMRNNTSTFTGMANALVQMVDTQSRTAHTSNQSSGTLSRMEETVNLMASTQSQIANDLNRSAGAQNHAKDTLDQIATTQTQIANAFTQSVDTQHRMEDTLNQIATTQAQMANALTQVVNLLQVQSEQLQNMTATMMYMVGQNQHQLISQQPNAIARDCSDLAARGPYSSGSYTIQPRDNLGSLRVYCDMDTDGGGWTVFQKRFDGTLDFYRGWNAYEEGFGTTHGEHWMGLSELYRLTRQDTWTLRIDLQDFDLVTAFAEFESFSVGDAASHYRLTVGAYSGNARDSLTGLNNDAFSTKDSDHDARIGDSCAQQRQGAWWYWGCAWSNLNGLYLGASQDSNTGMTWYHWKNSWEVLKRSEMKIRRTN